MANKKVNLSIERIRLAVIYCPFCKEELLTVDLDRENLAKACNFIHDRIERNQIDCDLQDHGICICDDCKAREFGK